MLHGWDDAEADLLLEATLDLDAGGVPRPMLLAFDGQRPLGVCGLRPFPPQGALAALVEVLALLLPLGADRLAWSLPGRLTADADGGDAREEHRALLVATARAGRQGPRLTGRLHPLTREEGRWVWLEPVEDPAIGQAALLDAVGILLEQRDALVAHGDRDDDLVHQVGRCVLLGHDVRISEPTAARLAPRDGAPVPGQGG